MKKIFSVLLAVLIAVCLSVFVSNRVHAESNDKQTVSYIIRIEGGKLYQDTSTTEITGTSLSDLGIEINGSTMILSKNIEINWPYYAPLFWFKDNSIKTIEINGNITLSTANSGPVFRDCYNSSTTPINLTIRNHNQSGDSLNLSVWNGDNTIVFINEGGKLVVDDITISGDGCSEVQSLEVLNNGQFIFKSSSNATYVKGICAGVLNVSDDTSGESPLVEGDLDSDKAIIIKSTGDIAKYGKITAVPSSKFECVGSVCNVSIKEGEIIDQTAHCLNDGSGEVNFDNLNLGTTKVEKIGETTTELIKDTEYSLSKGSVNVTLKKDYLKTLGVGTHKFKATLDDGTVHYFDIVISIEKAKGPSPVVKDESCEKVIGPTWHWNNAKGICEDYGVVGTATR